MSKTSKLLEKLNLLEGGEYDTEQTLDLTASQAKNAFKAFKAGNTKRTYERLIYVPTWMGRFLSNQGHEKAAKLAEQLAKELTKIYHQS